MKLHCILISLAFLKMSPIMTAEYAKSVLITNKHIEMAFATDPDGLEAVIKNIVNGDFTMEEISLMLVVPESSFIFNLPEFLEIAEQEKVQKRISRITNIPVPRLSLDQDIDIDSLPHLGVDRRSITEVVAKNLLTASIRGEEPAFLRFTEMCRLIGFYRSIIFPHSFTKDADVDSYGICILTSTDGFVYKYKRSYGKIVMEIPFGANGKGLVLLTEQISFWNSKVFTSNRS